MTANDIKKMAELKNKAQQTILDSVDSIINALQAFDGKSISGNKKESWTALTQYVLTCMQALKKTHGIQH
jgi:hypothetical protein